MNPQENQALIAEIQKTKMQSYFFLALLMVGVFTTAYMINALNEAKRDIEEKTIMLEESNTLLAEQNKQIKDQKKRLEELGKQLQANGILKGNGGSNSENAVKKEKLLKELFSLVSENNSKIDVSNLSALSVSELEGLVKKANKEEQEHGIKRDKTIKQLFSKSEANRKDARRKLQKGCSLDKELISSTLTAFEGKVNLDNKESYYQFIYLLTQLSSDMLKPEATALNTFFEEAEKAGLNGASTKRDIAKIRSKMK